MKVESLELGDETVDFLEVFDLSDVKPEAWMDFHGSDRMFFCGLEVEVDDAVALQRELGEQIWVKDVHSVECQFFIIIFGTINPFILIFLELFPTNQQVMFIKKQFSCGGAVLGEQPGIVMGLDEAVVIVAKRNVAENIDVMDKNGVCFVEEGQGLHDASSSIHECTAFIGDENLSIKGMGVKELDDLFSEMMDVDDDRTETVLDQVFYVVLQEWLPSDFHKGFGLVMGKLLETGAQACGEKHGGFIHGCAVRYGWFSR